MEIKKGSRFNCSTGKWAGDWIVTSLTEFYATLTQRSSKRTISIPISSIKKDPEWTPAPPLPRKGA